MSWEPQGPIDDMTIAGLPFPTAQRLLAQGRVRHDTILTTHAEWHADGPDGEPNQRSHCVARLGGPLEHLVGERLKIRHGRATIYAYCHRTFDVDDDLSLARNLFLRLAPLAQTNVSVLVEVVA